MERPMLGWGPGTYELVMGRLRTAAEIRVMGGEMVYQNNSHLLPLNVLATQGVIGLVIWAAFATAAWRGTARGGRAALLTVGACALTNPVHVMSYALAALAAGADYR